MIMRELKPLRSRGMIGSSGPLQQRRQNFGGVHRIGAAAHRPEHIVDIVGIDIVVDDDDIAAEIGRALALAGDQARPGASGPDSAGLIDRTVRKRRK